MKRRDHPSLEAARRELTDHGYWPAHMPPDATVQHWLPPKGKKEILAIGEQRRARSSVWHIVPAPVERPAADAEQAALADVG